MEDAAEIAAVDAREAGVMPDIEGARVVEVKGYGRSARGKTLGSIWDRSRLPRPDPHRFSPSIVENIRQGDPAAFRVLEITVALLVRLLERERE